MMLPPPGFCKPLWRGWEGAGRVRTDLAVAVAKIKHSIGGCHQEEVRREETHCPSANQHHYVRQVPHRCEVVPPNTQCNPFAQQKAGGQKPPPSVPRVIGQTMSCVICITRGTCMGKSCLGDNGKLVFTVTFTFLFS